MFRPLISSKTSIMLMVFCACGMLFLTIYGFCIRSEDVQFVHGLDPEQIQASSDSAFWSALVYFIVLVFGAFQWKLNANLTPIASTAFSSRGYGIDGIDSYEMSVLKDYKKDHPFNSVPASSASSSFSITKTI